MSAAMPDWLAATSARAEAASTLVLKKRTTCMKPPDKKSVRDDGKPMHGMRPIFQNCYSLGGRLQTNHQKTHWVMHAHRSSQSALRRLLLPSPRRCKPSRPNTKRGELKVPLQFWRGAFRSPRFDKPWRPSPRTERDRKVPSSSRLRRVAVKSDAAARSLRQRSASPALSAPHRRHIHAMTRKVSARTRRQSFACI